MAALLLQQSVVASAPGRSDAHAIPTLTPVEIETEADLGSAINKSGDIFSFHLHSPLKIDGGEVVPAGTPGRGEVVHALRAGARGDSGQLILAARYLSVGNRQLRLRSLHFAVSAEHKIGDGQGFKPVDAATGVGIEHVRPGPPVRLLGIPIHSSSEVFVPRGTVMTAKTAENFTIAIPGQASAGNGEIERKAP